MVRLATRLAVLSLSFALLAAAIFWLVAASPFFVDFRRDTIAGFLSEQIGQPVHVDGDTALRFERGIRFYVTDVVIPSLGIPEMTLADLERLEFDIAVHSWRPLDVWIDELWVRGLAINLLRDENAKESWELAEAEKIAPEEHHDIVDFLRGVTFRFENVVIQSTDAQSGFVFDFNLDDLDLIQQADRSVAALKGGGTINEEKFEVTGRFQRGGPFTSHFEFGQLRIEYAGTVDGAVAPTGHAAQLAVETGDIGNLLDVLQLERVFEGEGTLSAQVTYNPGLWSFSDANAELRFLDGAVLTASGEIGDFVGWRDVDLDISGQLHPDEAPPRSSDLSDRLQVTEFTGHVADQDEGVTLQDFHLRTNAALHDLGNLGPISVSRIYRSDEQIVLDGLEIAAGPSQSPYLHVEGAVQDLLQFQHLQLTGKADLPLEVLLGEAVASPERFGRLLAEFDLDDEPGHLALKKLDARVEDSSLWSLQQSAKIGEVSEIADVEYNLQLELPDADAVLRELGIAKVGAGSLGVDLAIKGAISDFSTRLNLRSGRTSVKADWRARIDLDTPSLVGSLASDRLDPQDITKAISALGALNDVELATRNPEAAQQDLQPLVLERGVDRTELQPLVLSKQDPRDDPDLQPLVLSNGGPSPDDPNLQPLVLGESRAGLEALESLLDFDQLLKTADARLAVNIGRIANMPFVSAVNSNLTLVRGRARLGPVDLRLDRGRASVTASMDLIRSPQHVSLSGRTDGWDIGQLTEPAGIPASGRIHGTFDLVGRNSSADAFLQSLSGKARLTVVNGTIGTSLIELSGLGVLPWLFSRELAAGRSRIGCIVAPLELRNGQVSSNTLVAETNKVQVVARGNIDLRRETISVRADARPLGNPLSPSAWPVTVTGNLRNPTVELARSRVQRRADAAKEMPTNRVPCKPDILQLR